MKSLEKIKKDIHHFSIKFLRKNENGEFELMLKTPSWQLVMAVIIGLVIMVLVIGIVIVLINKSAATTALLFPLSEAVCHFV